MPEDHRAAQHGLDVDQRPTGYAEEYIHASYGFALVPADALIRICWDAPDNDMRNDFDSWEEYAQDYWDIENDAEYANHLDQMWPVILNDGEGILDGWHRFHWYLRNGIKKIPAVLFM